MNVNGINLDGLVLVDKNADYSGTQTFFLDFDGAENVSYDNDALNIHLANLSVADSELTVEEQNKILTELNTEFAGSGIVFTNKLTEQAKYSTIYVGATTAFDAYGSFLGLAETIDTGNLDKTDNAFVLSNRIASMDKIVSTITHEAAHLVGFEHADAVGNLTIDSYALDPGDSVTLQIVNNFSYKSTYFSNNYLDSEVWLMYIDGDTSVAEGAAVDSVTYYSSGIQTSIKNETPFQLSDVDNGTFTITNGYALAGARLFAGLGSDAQTTLAPPNGPGIFDTDIPYSLFEWTVAAGATDNCDASYLDSFSFPTTLTVNNGSTQEDQSTFASGTTAGIVIDALSQAMPIEPTGQKGENYPQKGDAAGWGPLVPTIDGNTEANRWIGSSKSWQSGQAADSSQDLYIYAPSFDDYLQYLHDNEPVLFQDQGNTISGWYIDYSGNNGYSFYLSVNVDGDGNYGLNIHDIRVNTVQGSPWVADHTAGTAVTGDITVAANHTQVTYWTDPADHSQGTYDITGNWTDLTIYSGASALNPDFTSGPVITGTGDLGDGGAYSYLNPSFFASISASIATGLLGNKYYNEYIQAPKVGDTLNFPPTATPVATSYWFAELPADQWATYLFDGGWDNGEEYYDPFWRTMADATDMEGYLSTFSDRWSNLTPDFDLYADYSITWELGLPNSYQVWQSGDFDGNGKDDVLLQNGNTIGIWADADNSMWNQLGTIDSSSWKVAGIGDFNGNGSSDLLLEDISGGNIGYWEGGNSADWVSCGAVDPIYWQIIGCADFNGNGEDDILLQNTSNGLIGYWEGGNPANWVQSGIAAVPEWIVIGTGDFSGDGKDDILLQNNSTGGTGFWGDGSSANWTSGSTVDLDNWRIAGIGDYSGSSNADMLLQSTTTGATGIWESGDSSNWQSFGTIPVPSWFIESSGDYNNDGKDDILMKGVNNTDEIIGLWNNGSHWRYVGSTTTDWEICLAQ